MAVRDDFSAPRESGSNLVSLAIPHLGLLLSLSGVLIFFIRCAAIGRGDVQTTTTLILETSLNDAVRIVAFSLLEPLFAYLSIATAWAAGERSEERGWHEPSAIALALASMAFFVAGQYVYGFFVSAPWLLLGSLGVGALFTLFFVLMARWTARKRQEWSGFSPILSISGVIRLLVALVVIMTIPMALSEEELWLPPERFAFKGATPFTGYSLKTEGDYLVIFEDRRRIVVEFPKDDLLDRDFCGPGPSAVNRSRSAKHLPPCPDR